MNGSTRERSCRRCDAGRCVPGHDRGRIGSCRRVIVTALLPEARAIARAFRLPPPAAASGRFVEGGGGEGRVSVCVVGVGARHLGDWSPEKPQALIMAGLAGALAHRSGGGGRRHSRGVRGGAGRSLGDTGHNRPDNCHARGKGRPVRRNRASWRWTWRRSRRNAMPKVWQFHFWGCGRSRIPRRRRWIRRC